MQDNQAQTEPIETVLSRLEASLSEMKGEIKGIKGQQGLFRKELGLGRPGTRSKVAEPSPIQAMTAPNELETSPKQAEEKHYTYQWMKECPNCGGPNPDYKAPTVACSNCGVPLTSSDEIKKELQEKKETDKIKTCWNCGRGPESKDWQVKIL